MAKSPPVTMEELYTLKPKLLWRQFKSEHFSFWMICGYLFIEYVRPQSIIPSLDILPWASLFILMALIGALVDPTVKWVQASANKWMILYFIVILLSSFWAAHPEYSWKCLSFFYTWLVIYFLIINIVNTKKRLLIFLSIFILASFKISFSLARTWAGRGFSFTDWGLMGPPGFFANSGELAIQMSVFFPIAYLVSVKLKPYISKWVFYVLALMPVTAAMTILGASSRGGQIALAVQLILMFYKQIFRPKSLIAFALIIALGVAFVPEEQKQRFSESGSDKTSQQRLNYWRGGLEMLNDHPILGVGYFNFPSYFEEHYPSLMLYPAAQLPHNIFVQVGADLGYLGLFVYLMLVINCFFWGNKRKSGAIDERELLVSLPWALNISIVGFFVAGQFVSVVYYPFMWIHLALITALKNVWPTLESLAYKRTQKEGAVLYSVGNAASRRTYGRS